MKQMVLCLANLLVTLVLLDFVVTIVFHQLNGRGGEEFGAVWSPIPNETEGMKPNYDTWIFYNGIPMTGTSFLRLSALRTERFDIKDVMSWGCKPDVANDWRDVYEKDLLLTDSGNGPELTDSGNGSSGLSYVRAIQPVSPQGLILNQTRAVFATGHACWVNFSQFQRRPISVQTVQHPLSRWKSVFYYEISGQRFRANQLASRKRFANIMGIEDPFSPEITYENCLNFTRCISEWMVMTSLHERRAFTPCEECDPLPELAFDSSSLMRGITPRRDWLLARIRLMLMEYDALIPVEDMSSGLHLLEHKWPSVFSNMIKLESHARTAVSHLHQGHSLKGRRGIDQLLAERGGSLLIYKVACMKFCQDVFHMNAKSFLCEGFNIPLNAGYSPPIHERYLLWTSPLKGGLHNQLMILTHLGEVAMQLNRTLVVPQMLHDFPKRKGYLNSVGELDDIYNMSLMRRNGFPSHVLSIVEVPAALFVHNSFVVDLDNMSLDKSVVDSKTSVVRALEEYRHNQMLVVKRDGSQDFSRMKISSIYNAFQLSARLENVVRECLKAIFIADGATLIPTFQSDGPLLPLVFLHARVESDFLRYAIVKSGSPPAVEYYTPLSLIKEKVNQSSRELREMVLSATPTLVVSYAANELASGANPGVMKTGWPQDFRVVTSDELEDVLSLHTYLEKSAIMSQIAFKSQVFLGNTHSSFSLHVGNARKQNHGKTLFYNTGDTGFVTNP